VIPIAVGKEKNVLRIFNKTILKEIIYDKGK